MTYETVRYDLTEIDARARQMRADMLGAAFLRALAWLRKPRASAAPIQGRPA